MIEDPEFDPIEDKIYRRGLPFELEAEKCCLGQVLLNQDALDEAVVLFQPEDLSSRNAKVFRAMMTVMAAGLPIDLITLCAELRRLDQFEGIGGATYIASLIDGVPRLDMKPYAALIVEAAAKRRLLAVMEEAQSRLLDGLPFEDVIQTTEQQVFALAESRHVHEGAEHVAIVGGRLVDFYEQKSADPNALIGLSTGYKDIDRMTLGLTPGLTLVVARPRCGKTSLVTNISCNVAEPERGGSVYLASIESPSEKIVQRILSSMSRVDSYRMRSGYMNREEWARIADTLRKLAIMKFVVDDTPDLSPEQLTSRCRQHKSKYGLDLVVVDYIQLMARRLMYKRRYRDLRIAVQEVGAGLTDLSRSLNVPVLGVAQASREVDNRPDHMPQLSDLAESASLEQDADIVMFLYREELYKPTDENQGVVKVIFAKQRDGAEGEVELMFIKSYTRFEDLALREKEPEPTYKRTRGSSWGKGGAA